MGANRGQFAQMLRQQRLRSGLSQATLAERARLSRRAIQHLESGLSLPHPESVRRLANALELTEPDRAAFAVAATDRSLPIHQNRAVTRPRRAGRLPQQSSAPGHNLPVQLTSFIGRESQVEDVARLLGDRRMLTLIGAGGVGKTRLALEAATRVVSEYPDGVWFVDLAPLADPALVAQSVAVAGGVRAGASRPVAETLRTAFAQRQLLLVLDNCEHLVEACAALADHLLRACPRLRILATSRERLGIAGESTWRVPSLKLPAPGAARLVDALVGSEAGRLFVTRAQAVQHDFELNESNAAAVARICSRLDGIPLAIELAAAHVTALTPESLARRLDDSLRLLVGGGRTAPERQQTLQATLDWSYALLPETDQVVLDRLSVFAGSCSLGAAEAVCAGDGIDPTEILGALVQLVDKSLTLIGASPTESRTKRHDGATRSSISRWSSAWSPSCSDRLPRDRARCTPRGLPSPHRGCHRTFQVCRTRGALLPARRSGSPRQAPEYSPDPGRLARCLKRR
jgi:predicted ATPase/DNA-binding XRE family transcriptional regulator